MRKTHNALLASFLAILLCLTMLVGTTFAWFNDTVSVNANIIATGKLDILLEKQEADGGWTPVKDTDMLGFTPDDDSNDELWEPGETYNFTKLRVVNNGSLALKYQIHITGIEFAAESGTLNDVITWTVKVGDHTYNTNENFEDITYHLVPGDIDEITIVGKMHDNPANKYQGMTLDNVKIDIYATQDTAEYDSIDNKYDDISFPILIVNGVDIIADEDNIVKCGEGTAVYDHKTNTLTLKNATIDKWSAQGVNSDKYAAVYAAGIPLTIVLEGNNIISSEYYTFTEKFGVYGILGGDISPITVTGSGTLNISLVKAKYSASSMCHAFRNVGDINIENVNVSVLTNTTTNSFVVNSEEGDVNIKNATLHMGESSENFSFGIVSMNGSVNIDKSNVNLQCRSNGIKTYNDINIRGNSDVDATVTKSGSAVYAEEGNITVTDSTLKAMACCYADSDGYPMYALGNITFENANVTATVTDGYSFAIRLGGVLTVDSSYLNANGKDYRAVYTNCCDFDCDEDETPDYTPKAGIRLINACEATGHTIDNSGWKYWGEDEYWEWYVRFNGGADYQVVKIVPESR